MRALFNLIFFIAVLAVGGLVGYLYGLTGKPVPYVSEQLTKVQWIELPSPSAGGPNSEELEERARAQAQAIDRLQQSAQQKDQAIAQLSDQLRQAQASAGSGGGNSQDTQLLEENNLFLTDELTRLSSENLQLAAQLEAATSGAAAAGATAPANSGNEQIAALQAQLQAALNERQGFEQQLASAQQRVAELVSSAGGEAGSEQLAELQAQVQRLVGERQNLITQLTSVDGQRRAMQQQMQVMGQQLQAQGIDVQSLFNAAQQAIQNQAGGNN